MDFLGTPGKKAEVEVAGTEPMYYRRAMRITSGKVIDGRIEVAGERLTEGTTVTVLAPENEDTFRLGPKEGAELLASIEEADRGETDPGDEVLRKISAR